MPSWMLAIPIYPASILDKASDNEVSDYRLKYPTWFSLILSESSKAKSI